MAAIIEICNLEALQSMPDWVEKPGLYWTERERVCWWLNGLKRLLNYASLYLVQKSTGVCSRRVHQRSRLFTFGWNASAALQISVQFIGNKWNFQTWHFSEAFFKKKKSSSAIELFEISETQMNLKIKQKRVRNSNSNIPNHGTTMVNSNFDWKSAEFRSGFGVVSPRSRLSEFWVQRFWKRKCLAAKCLQNCFGIASESRTQRDRQGTRVQPLGTRRQER